MNSLKLRLSYILIPILGLICLFFPIGAALALILGILSTTMIGNPYATQSKIWTPRLLSLSIVGLGAGMNLLTVAQTGVAGIGYTAISITLTILVGVGLGIWFKIDRESSLLITIGTAICGGSAIAALAPVIHAKHHNISVALGVVFMLNALALIIFPAIGHYLNLSQLQFGLWSALAIHDTSSVVGAGLKYGAEALQTGTTIKLARALWIVPLVFIIQAALHQIDKRNASSTEDKNSTPEPKRKYPWFILGFLVMAAIFTYMPEWSQTGDIIETGAKKLLVLTLFLIGSNLTLSNIKAVGIKPLILGVLLWICASSVSLLAIYEGWISVS
ncbi:MAG: putative sulfate exporter family transporter [Alphaproteobacteria bacterium]|nr:putative sulfate exporter family transporter [Alphaproteobacteria bacterium]